MLEKINETNGMQPIQTSENIPRLRQIEGNKIKACILQAHYMIFWSLRISHKQTELCSVCADGGLSPLRESSYVCLAQCLAVVRNAGVVE